MELSDGVHISALPHTFRDAIHVINALGVHFLWIDALCILQDSVADWQHESSSMGKVYQGALYNIAATAASNSHEGCFRERSGSLVQPVTIQSNWLDHPNGDYHIYDKCFKFNDLDLAPLLCRPWIVQERFIAQRVLHFGARQLFWECHELSACETYPHRLLPTMKDLRGGPKRSDPRVHNLRSPKYVPDLWTIIIKEYSDCHLTREEDKLIALSSVAKELQKISNDQYLAGL